MSYNRYPQGNTGTVTVTGTVTGTFQPTGLTTAGRVSIVTINQTTWTALPTTPLTARNAINVQNMNTQTVKVNYDNTTVGYVGMTIFVSGGERQYAITPSIVIYAKSETSSCDLNIEELS